MPLREHLAQQRTGADADREHHEQQRRDALVAVQHVFRERREQRQEHRAEEPHPRDAEQRAEHDDVLARQHQVAPGFCHGVPVDAQVRIGAGGGRHRLRRHAPQQRERDTADRHVAPADIRDRHQQPARHLPEQDRHERTHLDHAVAAGQLALAQVLRQVGELDRAEDCRVQTHQQHAAEQHINVGRPETERRERHDRDLEVLDEADHLRLVVLVGDLAGSRREHEKRQDEQRADDEAGHARRQPADLQLVGDHHGERELEQVVVAGAEKLGPEERREAALLQQRELIRVSVLVRVHAASVVDLSVCWSAAGIYRITCTGPPRPLRLSHAKTESTVTVSMRSLNRFSLG